MSFSKQDETLRSHVYIMAVAGGPERRIAEDDRVLQRRQRRLVRRRAFLAYTVQAGTGGGMASTGGRAANQMKLMALPLRALDKDPLNKDIDSEAQALAADGRCPRARGGAPAGLAALRAACCCRRPSRSKSTGRA